MPWAPPIRNLPTFVNIGRPSSPVQLTGGYLGATVAATPFQPGATPIPNLVPAGRRQRRRTRTADASARWNLNEDFGERYAVNTDIAARAKAFELAARMQLAAPQVVDFVQRTASRAGSLRHRRKTKPTISAGNCCSPAAWPNRACASSRSAMPAAATAAGTPTATSIRHGPLCRATDKPIAGLIRDLKQRGMLDETLVVWTSEFGRSPWSQNTTGRDHNPRGYTAWLAGGGIKGGIVHGATDDVGYQAVDQSPLLQRPARHHSQTTRTRS